MSYLNLVPSAHNLSSLSPSYQASPRRLHTDWQARLRRRMLLDDLIETHEDAESAQPESATLDAPYHHAA